MVIVPALPTDASTLTKITQNSKAYWGYSARQLALWKDELTIAPAYIEKNCVFKLCIQNQPVAYYSTHPPEAERVKLENLFVLPECIGKGLGKKLLAHAIWQARAAGAEILWLESDPQAAGFYQKQGFKITGQKKSSIPGRYLPVLELRLKKRMMIKGFIFDMDGTMVDNMMVHHRAWQRKLAALGLELSLEEVRQSIHGINEEIIERLFGERFTPEQRRQIAWEKEAEYREIFRPELKLIDGLDAFLQQAALQKIPMGIGTAAPPENVEFVLTELQLKPLFQAVIDAKMVRRGKPDPEVFLRVAEQLELAPEHCLVFEDSPTGAEAAQRGGMASVIITTTHTPDEFSRFDNILRIAPDFTALQPGDWVGQR